MSPQADPGWTLRACPGDTCTISPSHGVGATPEEPLSPRAPLCWDLKPGSQCTVLSKNLSWSWFTCWGELNTHSYKDWAIAVLPILGGCGFSLTLTKGHGRMKSHPTHTLACPHHCRSNPFPLNNQDWSPQSVG